MRPFASGALPPLAASTAQIQAIRTVSANTTLTAVDYAVRVNTTSGNVTITLPTGAAYQGMIYQVKKVAAANSLLVTSAHAIDGVSTQTVTALNSNLTLQYDFASASWNIL